MFGLGSSTADTRAFLDLRLVVISSVSKHWQHLWQNQLQLLATQHWFKDSRTGLFPYILPQESIRGTLQSKRRQILSCTTIYPVQKKGHKRRGFHRVGPVSLIFKMPWTWPWCMLMKPWGWWNVAQLVSPFRAYMPAKNHWKGAERCSIPLLPRSWPIPPANLFCGGHLIRSQITSTWLPLGSANRQKWGEESGP